MRLPLVALLLLVAHSSRAQSLAPTAAAAELARRLAGCYQLDDGPWRADSVRAGDVSTARTPLHFELTDQQVGRWESRQSSEQPLFAVRPSTGSWSYWQRGATTPDTIRLGDPLALAGVALTLTPVGRDLVGTVEAFTDAVVQGEPSEVRRPVYARRVPCPPA